MIRLFLGVMAIAGVALGLAIAVGVFWGMLIVGMGTARAQQQQRPLLQVQCTPIGSMAAATEYRLPFRRKETGYFWSLMRFSTGRVLIGFVTPAGDFCITDEAEEPPRT